MITTQKYRYLYISVYIIDNVRFVDFVSFSILLWIKKMESTRFKPSKNV